MYNKLSKIGLFLPQIYFFAICCIIAANPNFVMIGVAVFLLALIFIKNKILNVGVAAFLLFFSFWMLLAFLSDFHEITIMDQKAWEFVILGSLFVLANFAMSLLMGYPFFREQVLISKGDDYYIA